MSEKFLQQIEAKRKKQIWLSTVEQIASWVRSVAARVSSSKVA